MNDLLVTWSENVFELVHALPCVQQDFKRWSIDESSHRSLKNSFCAIWLKRQEFRTLVKYRLKNDGCAVELSKLLSYCRDKPWAFVINLYISCDNIGSGFYIEHGFSTIIYAKSVGNGFRVNQNVTVGTNKGGMPTIGDNVSIYTGAVVAGDIEIGNNVKIGANSVVLDNVPDNSIVVPAKSVVLPR